MRYFLLSVSVLLLAACGQPAYHQLRAVSGDASCLEKFQPVWNQTLLYDAHIDVVGKQLSGLLLIKQMPDSSVRLVFTSPAGTGFFDVGFKGNDFRVYSVIPQLDKKAVITTLQKDFRLTWMLGLADIRPSISRKGNERYYDFTEDKDHYYYITDEDCANLLRMERGSARKKIVTVTRKGGTVTTPDSIAITHHNFNFDISLQRIIRDAN